MKCFVLFLCLGASVLNASENYPMSDHFDGKIFYNQDKSIVPKGFKDLMKWWFFTERTKWPKEEVEVFPIVPLPKIDQGIKVTYIGHENFLIQTEGLNLLTDPVYSERTSPVGFAGPKRAHLPGIRFEDLPQIDVVYVSHNHYDHMDSDTIKRLSKKFSPLFITPPGNKENLQRFGAHNIIELDWWQTHQLKENLILTMTPAQHWSGRSPFDRRKALWGSFFLKANNRSIYFAGDTGYGPHFTEIQKRQGDIDLALLPIGAYEPRWFMKDIHMNPEDAVLAHLDLKAKQSLGMHFGMFQLTNEGIDTPLQDLDLAVIKHKVDNFKTLKPGQSLDLLN